MANVPPRLPDRSAARGYALTNLVLPGLGTWASHRRIAGTLQLLVSQTGFLLSVLWAILFVREWISQGSFPEDVTTHLSIGLIGVAWAVGFWFWFRDDPASHRGVNAVELATIRAGSQAEPEKPKAEPVPWGEVLARLSRLPVISIAGIHGPVSAAASASSGTSPAVAKRWCE